MNGEFSEFSYGFALTHEIVNNLSGHLSAAPVFPSLIMEGRPGGGYDMALDLPGYPLFLQFKISEYMMRRSAGEWKLFKKRYYRFWLHASRHSDQHRLLLDLDKGSNCVFYAAPAIHRSKNLNSAFLAGKVMENSVFFRPSAIGSLPDANAHCIAFLPGDPYGWRCSEPAMIRMAAHGVSVLDVVAAKTLEGPPVAPENFFPALLARLEESAETRSTLGRREFSFPSSDLTPRARAAYLTRTILGAELLWVTDRNRNNLDATSNEPDTLDRDRARRVRM